ncbi:MAG: hypothetical protein FJ382_10600 [Verrucomicrobia bacterium]|nr:hypothetical protein [Verrucomicrobiota bacterium]
MNDHPEVPRLPKLPFIASDLFLLLVAGFIAYQAPSPFEGGALVAIVACVVVGGILLGIPFIAEYGRRTDALLRERQDEIAALAKTTAACAEQISIATASLHALAEDHARSARALESLPQKLQEKVAELKSQLNEINVAQNEALEQELQALRAAESDRLQSAVDELAKLSREFARIEAAAARIVSSLPQAGEQAAAQVGTGIAQASGSAAKELEATLARARRQLTEEAGEAQSRSLAAWSARTTESLREFESRLESLTRRLSPRGPGLAPSPAKTVAPDSAATPPTPAATATAPAPAAPPPPAPAPAPAPARAVLPAPVSAHPPSPPAPAVATAAPPSPAPPAPPTAPSPPAASERAPTTATPPAPTPASTVSATDAPASAPRRIADRPAGGRAVEAALSSDGATRLLVTAYIGIGNKLFVRGSGPGLSWEKGVPLNFVSIGKWRWDTPDATGTIQVKVYKNDQVECVSLGLLELEPGRQHEVTATF